MGLINFLGESKVIKKICELLNVKDVKVNGASVVDSSGDAVITVPANTSDLNNDSGFIDNTVNNLANYYLKSETYTQAEVNALIGSVTTISFLIVQTLPASGQSNIIYLVPKSTAQTDNVYDEYIWISNDWEKIGDTEIDLSNYYTKTEADAKFSTTDEKVKQTAMGTDAKDYRVLLTTTDTNTEETNVLRKCSALTFRPSNGQLTLARVHTGTANTNEIFEIGNNIPNGTAGNVTGVLRLYGKSTHYGQFDDSGNILTGDRTYGLPDKNGLLALTDDITSAIQSLDGSVTGTPSASKTLTSFSETDGVVSATFGDISITKSQMTDYCKNLSTEDLNDVRTSGFYIGQQNNSCANKPSISPAIQQFGLIVSASTTSTNKYCHQILFAPSTGVIWERHDINDTWSSWVEVKTTDENVKQVAVGTTTNQYRVLLTTSTSNEEETNTVRKCSGLTYQPSNGALRLARPHSSTSAVSEFFAVGNNIAKGTAGNVYGALRLFSQDTYYVTFFDRFGSITANRNYQLPDKTGTLALRDNITRAKLDNNWNLWSSPCYTGDNTSGGITYVQSENSVVFTGTATSQLTYYVRRYSEEWTLPAGKYRLSGCPSGGGSSSYRLRVGADTRNTTTTWLGYDEGNGYEFTLTEEKVITITFNIYNGYAIQDTLVVTPTLVRLDGGWVELGTGVSGGAWYSDVFSEYMVEFTINYSSGQVVRIEQHNLNIIRSQITDIFKEFSDYMRFDNNQTPTEATFYVSAKWLEVQTGVKQVFLSASFSAQMGGGITLTATPKLYGKI